ncbi:MAG: glycosyl hydrolase-related protein [Ignavibacteriales bacterium]|nr:glycosyl hydrolase-related protein [Ignavibacteriales bacterium]
MKLLKAFSLILFISEILFSQTPVDKISQKLEFLSTLSFNDWKISEDLTKTKVIGDPTQKDFDDSQWKTVKLDEQVRFDSCWLRKEITIPTMFLGKPLTGKIKLLVSVDDFGYMFINGVSKGYFPWDGEFVLSENVKPGDKFLIAIKAINTGGPLRLIRAQPDLEKLKPIQQKIQDFALSLQTGQKLLSFDTYQQNSNAKVDPGIDKSTISRDEKEKLNKLLQEQVQKLEIEKLESGDLEGFEKSLDEVRVALKPVSEFARRFILYFDSNAHIDAAWLWRSKETIEVCHKTFNSVFNIMDAKPDFTYTQSAAAYYDWMEKLYPDVYQKIKDRIKDARWEVIGGMWIEPDCNLIGGESWMRQILLAKKYFKEKLGQDVRIGWNPDSFGYNWNMPMFYKNAGIDAFITQKISWNETNVFPYRVFWWESPDGSRILTYFPFDYTNSITQAFQFIDWMRQYEANTGYRKLMVLFGVGDHGGGPTIDMIDRIERLQKLDIYPTIEYGTATKYLDWLKEHDLTKLPVWKNELYLEYHQGTFTTQAKNKEYNRKSEVLLTNTEKFSSFAKLFGAKYNAADLQDAWKTTLFNQFHDILPGSGIREVYIDAIEEYKEVEKVGIFILQNSLKEINGKINTTKITKGIPLTVFNSLNWNRTDVVKLQLSDGEVKDYSVFDLDGKEIPSQTVRNDKLSKEIIFIAKDVPSLGYKTYELRVKNEERRDQIQLDSKNSLENEFFKINIDLKSGWINSIVDKRNGKEILKGDGNELQLLEDKPRAWDAWNVGLTGVKYPSTFQKTELIEDGSVRTVIRLFRNYLKPGVQKDFPTENFPSSFFTQDIILYKDLARIDFKTDVDWWEDKTMLKVAFPLSFSDSVATYEIPYGTITRSTGNTTSWEKAQYEVPAIRWADVSSGNYGVSLINNSKYGYDIKGNVMRLSLLRSPKWPDPTADRGKHSIEYSLYPHQGNWKEANTVRTGYEFNYPLIAVVNDLHKGELPDSKSFVQLDADNLILTQIKKAEDSDAWVLQWYESKGKDTDAKLILPVTPKKIVLSNFLEDDKEQVLFEKNLVVVPTKKNEVKTIKIYF